MASSSSEMLSDMSEAHLGEIGGFGLEIFDEYMKKQSALQKAELNHGSTKLLQLDIVPALIHSCEIIARAFSSDPRMSSLLLKASKEVPLPPHVKQESQRGHVVCAKLMS